MIVAVLGTIIPPMVILSVISVFYNAFATNRYIALLLKGMQAGVAAVILDVVFDLGGKVLKTRSWVYICLLYTSERRKVSRHGGSDAKSWFGTER